HPYAAPPEHTHRARGILGPDALLAPELGAVLECDRERARAIARRHLRLHLGLDNYRNNLLRLGWQQEELAAGGSDRLIDALAASGDPDVIIAAVHAHLDAGADHVALQLFGDEG